MAIYRWRWWPWHPYSDWSVKRRARLDGRAAPPIPRWDAEEPAPFIHNDLRSAGEHDIQVIAAAWAQEDSRLRSRWAQAAMVTREAGRRVEAARTAHEAACAFYTTLHQRTPPLGDPGRTMAFGLWMALLFLFELPLNAVVFRIFRENEALTILFTCGVAIVLLLCAHELGKLLREGAWHSPATRSFIIGLILLPAAIIGGVAYARQIYLEYLPDVLQTMNPWVIFGAFAAMNLAIFAVATALSHRHYEAGLGDVLRTAARLHAAGCAHLRARRAEQRAYQRRVQHFDLMRGLRDVLEDEARRLKGLYETHNLYWRTDREQEHRSAVPRSFLAELRLVRPPVFERALEWPEDNG